VPFISIIELINSQGWGVAVLVGVPHKDAVFKTHPMNVLNERTLKGTFFGNYKPRSDLPSVVEMYMNKVYIHRSTTYGTVLFLRYRY
jgi:Zn-dependent alcohol dehydrogenase